MLDAYHILSKIYENPMMQFQEKNLLRFIVILFYLLYFIQRKELRMITTYLLLKR